MNLLKGATTAVKQCMNIQQNEKVLILTDTNMPKEISKALLQASRKVTNKVDVEIMEPLEIDGQEPAREIADLMETPDVLFIPTSTSLSHTKARREASKNGVRIASMPGVTTFSFTDGGLTADYKQVDRLCRKMFDIIKNDRKIKITSLNGTNLEIQIGDFILDIDNGLFHKAGDFGNLPAGEVDTAPNEGTTNGVFVADKMGKYGDSVKAIIENGEVIDVINSDFLDKTLSHIGKKARNIAELGIGTNPKARIIGNVLEDEKVFGTVHVAFGNNTSYGGKCDVQFHIDGIIANPTLIVGGKTVIKNGKWV